MRIVKQLLLVCLIVVTFGVMDDANARNHHKDKHGHKNKKNEIVRLKSTIPKADSKARKAPREITLKFTQPVSVKKSTIQLFDQFGHLQNQDAIFDEDGRKTLRAHIPRLRKGIYMVRWRTQCACPAGTELSDSFDFTVR